MCWPIAWDVNAPRAAACLEPWRLEPWRRAQVVLEGALVNLDVTSPGATLALALMFLKTGDAAVAAAFAVPGTRFALDYVCPDLVQLRVLARALVLWADIAPTQAWVQAQLPPLIQARPGRAGHVKTGPTGLWASVWCTTV